ncbi:hypothetical protein [Streptomyces sp. NPDC059247]|uniref:hypothetical protein n=1 Tax=Streptomyces sp. NPDC059247 TaxID=3346790 RepID=UPI0036971A3B
MVRGVRGRRRGTLLLAGVLAFGASGCGPGDAPVPGGPPSVTSGPALPGTATGPGTPATEPRPDEVLVEVVVSGGFAGIRNRLVVRYDGAWTSGSGGGPARTGRQSPAEAGALRAALEDPAYAQVPDRPTGRPIADGFQYELTHRGRLVVAGDGERPPALQRVFAALPEGGPPTSP